jgi:hypothetical protein
MPLNRIPANPAFLLTNRTHLSALNSRRQRLLSQHHPQGGSESGPGRLPQQEAD